jgi:hypothetical protein
MKNILIILAFLIISPIMIRGVVATLSDNPDATPYEVTTQTDIDATEYRDAFVAGCQEADGMTEAICSCMHDRLVATYGQQYLLDNASRWSNGDVSDAEFEVIKPCASV